MFHTLSKRILLSNMVLTSIVLIGAFVSLFFYSYMEVRYENRSTLFSLPSMYRSGSVVKIAAQGNMSHYQIGSGAVNRMFFIITVDEQGVARHFNKTSDGVVLEEVYQTLAGTALKNRGMDDVITFGNSKLQAYITVSEQNNDEREIYFLDVTSQYKSLTSLLVSFLWIAPLTLIPIFFISLYTAKRATKPIREAWEQQRRFIADASHELKTPLAIIAANADAILVDNDCGNTEWVAYIKDEIERMTKLTGSLLALVKADDGMNKITTSVRFDLSLCVDETITLYEAAAFEKGIDLRRKIEEGVFLNSDEGSMRRIISALLENAVKYTNPNGFITISLHKNKRAAELIIENSGMGILPEDLPHIFERFYRADKARENEDGSFGLGLPIVRSLLEQIGGEINARSTPNQSTVFIVRIKKSGEDLI